MSTQEFNEMSKAERNRYNELLTLERAARGIVPPKSEHTPAAPGARNSFGFPRK